MKFFLNNWKKIKKVYTNSKKITQDMSWRRSNNLLFLNWNEARSLKLITKNTQIFDKTMKKKIIKHSKIRDFLPFDTLNIHLKKLYRKQYTNTLNYNKKNTQSFIVEI